MDFGRIGNGKSEAPPIEVRVEIEYDPTCPQWSMPGINQRSGYVTGCQAFENRTGSEIWKKFYAHRGDTGL